MMVILKKILFFICLSLSVSVFSEEVSLPHYINNGPKWKEFPKVDLSLINIQGREGEVITNIEANQKGIITSVQVLKSSGFQDVDQKVIEAVKKASFYPYQENGIYYPIRVEQSFVFNDSNLNISPSFFEAKKYKIKYQAIILSAWNIPVGSEGMMATVKVDLDNNGQVVKIVFLAAVEPKFKRSIEKAIYSVSPFDLPTDPNIRQIVRKLTINFKAK
ncbi:TonB family protein [Acinetobacter courvalinii]|uniref:TonB family protein n=1 Tax=Acinetobacter courvalinii TaxID=280147 RepID=UPI0002D093C9|nr:TonB family protein [Acinetobacter courvalinii]ENX05605.1 hypothetical protein F898_02549 [Acinetobacter courvalinii]MCU4367067.1 TonB family protein [Acinetobacter courvalinii]MCU4445273.1 TonB family protein [Acinetobacter courvalinii]